MITFNSDNLIVGEIKQLLKTFNLPSCKVYKPGIFAIQGEYYIYRSYIIRCLKTGFAPAITKEQFEKIELYQYGEKIPGITKTYALDSFIYDQHVHKYLGDYLRFYSDYYNINLMSMYNCFSNETANNVTFGKIQESTYDRVKIEDPDCYVLHQELDEINLANMIYYYAHSDEGNTEYFDQRIDNTIDTISQVMYKNINGETTPCLICNYELDGGNFEDGNYDVWAYAGEEDFDGETYARWDKYENTSGEPTYDEDLELMNTYMLTDTSLVTIVEEYLAASGERSQATKFVDVETTTIEINHTKSSKNNTKVYAVPIKMFKEYTIGIDCDTPIELMLDFYDKNFEVTVVNKEVMNKLHEYSYTIERSCRFNRPFLFSKSLFNDGTFSEDLLEEFMKQENSFKLLIKVPNKNESTISVVEGNYIKNCDVMFNNRKKLSLANIELIANETPVDIYSYITKMELFKINSCVQHPFANRLIEYLTDNVISNADTIEKNIEKTQLSLYHPKMINGKPVRRLDKIKYPGIWEKDIRQAIYKDALREKCQDKYYDLLYFVDKDIEEDIIKEASEYGLE